MRMKTTICSLFGVLLIVGCQNTVNTVENADKEMTSNTIKDTRFITDGFLRDRLALKGVNVSKTPDGFMRVQLEVVNVRTGFFSQMWSGLTGENPYKISYKFFWFDQAGMAVDGIIYGWQSATVIPGETIYLQSVAPTKDCCDFKVNLKEAD